MIPYHAQIPRAAIPGSALTAIATIIGGAVRSMIFYELDFNGRDVASSDNEIGLYRVATAGTTGASALTFTTGLAPNMTGTTPALAFSGTGFGAYTTQPLKGALLHNLAINGNGQRAYWRAQMNLNDAYPVPGGNNAAASVALYPIAGTANISGRVGLFEV